MGNLFGTDGVRGIANKELTGELVYRLARAAGFYLTKDTKKRKPRILIGKDTRLSGDMLESALAAGMNSVGIDVIKLGVIPTPGVSYLTSISDVDGAVMISASHNPIEDNGIKFFDKEGYKLTDEMENSIEGILEEEYDEIPSPISTGIGRIEHGEELITKYMDYLINSVALDFSGLKVVLDCACGAAYRVAPEVLRSLGAELIVINNSPSGEKINLNCGSTHPEMIQKIVREEGADLGIAHDGDADRVIMVDENGELIDGDKIMAVCSLDMMKNNRLKENTLVVTPYSNLGLHETINESGGKVVVAENGDRYVLAEMLKNGYNLGGEQSGHIIFLDYNRTGDGILTAIQTCAIVKKTGKSIGELSSVMKTWPQRLKNIKVKNKNWEDYELIKKAIEKAEEELAGKGRIFVRASGTEPLIRIMLEGKDEVLLEKIEKEISEIIDKELA